jgi:hypothetical protein
MVQLGISRGIPIGLAFPLAFPIGISIEVSPYFGVNFRGVGHLQHSAITP